MSTLNSTAIQAGLDRASEGKLRTLWILFRQICNLSCSYCFANGDSKLRDYEAMSKENYVFILDQAHELGIDSIGIPGIGEPLLPCNQEFTLWFLRECAKRGIYVTLFTTGQHITFTLACILFELPVELMVKGNSLNPDKQDRFVSDPARGRIIHGYGEARNTALEILMAIGFNDEEKCMNRWGRKSRMALVTSIMTDGDLRNDDEIGDILRYCRDRNVIFDCDTVLKIGRGASCGLSLEDELQKQIITSLQTIDREEYGNAWDVSRGYVGSTACDRCMHHLFIQDDGTVSPCIGSTSVILGNAKTTKLIEAFNHPVMCLIRARQYGGVCRTQCQNFAEGKCNSCLGRSAVDLSNQYILKNGHVNTIGCWNFRQK